MFSRHPHWTEHVTPTQCGSATIQDIPEEITEEQLAPLLDAPVPDNTHDFHELFTFDFDDSPVDEVPNIDPRLLRETG